MQLMEHWDTMAKFALHNDKSGGCILNSLHLSIWHLGTPYNRLLQ